jgi:nucleotide-binding universal stress UspA family protein
MILITDDGSPDARAAIDRAARLMPGATVTVLTVWESFVDVMARSGSMGMGYGMAGSLTDDGDIDRAAQRDAVAQAENGAARATEAGLVAAPRSERCGGTIANTILAVAEHLDAELIVLGTRGRSSLESALLGSVSHAVLQHADRAVLIVPTAAVSEQRQAHILRLAARA